MDLRGLPSVIMSQVLKKYPLVIRDIRKHLLEEERRQGLENDDVSKSGTTRCSHRSDGAEGADELEITGQGGRVTTCTSRLRTSQYDDPIPLDHYFNAQDS